MKLQKRFRIGRDRRYSRFYLPSVVESGMEVYDRPGPSQQDYDVPPSNRGALDLPGPSVALDQARRGSHDSQRSGLGSRPGSRKGSLANDLYDTPPSSKRASGDTINSNASGIYDTPPSSKRASSERTPPPSNRSSSASQSSASNVLIGQTQTSGHSSSPSPLHHLNLPPALQQRRRSGGSGHSSDNCYETPPGSNRSSLERILSEEGPPIYESLSPASSTDRLAGDDCEEPTYDTPPNRGHHSHIRHKHPHTLSNASQSSLHSAPSIESLLSNTSGASSTQLSHNASLPDSARSSMDLPAETYDVPPSAQHGGEASRKQLSTDSGLGFYDSPIKSRPSSSTSGSNVCISSQSGTLKSSQSSFSCKPLPSSLAKDIKRSRSLEHALDDLYDTPKNNAPKVNLKSLGSVGFGSVSALNDPASVYDIPPQVTRDSVISARSDSSGEDSRFSSSSLELECKLEAPVWDVLPLDLDSALELLVKRQQHVSKATSRLAAFINEDWRTRASLEKTLYDIKVACSLIKTALQEFVEFSLKALSNAIRLPDHQLAAKLQKQVSPLQSTLEFVNKSFQNLEEAKWQVALLSEPLPKNKPDDLGQIALVAKDLLPEVKRVASYIQSNGPALFKKSSDYRNASLSSKPPRAHSDGYGTLKQKDIQHRPLPAVPGSVGENSLPGKSLASEQPPSLSKLSLYDIKSALHQDDYAECDALPSPTPEHSHYTEMKNLMQEYDYVELDSRDETTAEDQKNVENVSANVEENTGTLKAHRNKTDFKEDMEQELKNSSDAQCCGSVDSDLDDIPIRDSSPSQEKTPTDKTGPLNSLLGGHDSNMIFDGEDEIGDQDLKTPVNLSANGSCPTQDQTFVLPDTALSGAQKELDEIVDEVLDPSDRQVLIYYSEQMTSHATLLANATDAFLGVVAGGQPPSVFISHSKFLIVSAHKLVHIGDSIHRNLASNTVSANIMHCANNLCDCLKASVTATKTAALQYPSGPALQEMVDRVMDVSHAAHELRLIIKQAIK
ncbi:breast cancer anti-estrogen resistance protein 1 [Elysia marginata]|uniref:Breast cancer anti-estrogen resistance protein 1 n=1 Tax=Elysia marginata TaxID=1093978 RepID=A0AAV4J1W7_9GAST|nr:breast cancer anti-estrogen resistance protein 1 [Elysia marginata]